MLNHWYDGPRLAEVGALLDDHGRWVADRTCACCGQKKVAEIRYGEGANDRFFACQRCDRTEGKA
jgi:hypothetical protein